MSYRKETVDAAKRKLAERCDTALHRAEVLRRRVYTEKPRLDEIDCELSRIGAQTASAVLRGKDAGAMMQTLSEKSLQLQQEYREIMASLHLDENALEPHYACEKCRDTGYVREVDRTVMCDCLKKLIIETACEELNAISPLELSSFASFDLTKYSDAPDREGHIPRERMRKIYQYCVDYADNFSINAKSVYMSGKTGLGKTHLSLAIARRVIEQGYSVVYVSTPELLSRLERAHFGYRYDDEDNTLRSLSDCDLLILDDLGTEFRSPYTTSTIYNLFNARLLQKKPTIISTNLEFEQLIEAYSQRFMSRVMGEFDILDFIGRDIRVHG